VLATVAVSNFVEVAVTKEDSILGKDRARFGDFHSPNAATRCIG